MPAAGPRGLPPFAARAVVGIALATVALLLAFATRDGYHRDELYFLAASHHLALGYVDQPPLAVLGAWLSRTLFGETSLLGLRAIPALLDGAAIVLTGLIARELGGRAFAQAFAALCSAVCGFLIIAHLAGPTAYDLVAWLAASLILLRILRTQNRRLWLVLGGVVGVGLEAKATILFLCFGLAVGLLATRRWRLLADRYLWGGVAIALALWAPNLIWDAVNGWPTAEMDRNLRAEHNSLGAAAKYPGIQLLLPNIFLAPVWIAGLWALAREQRFAAFRPFAVAYVVLLVLIWVLIPDRPYYFAPLYAVLFAAGAIVVDEKIARRSGLLWRSRRGVVAYAVVAGVVTLPLALPVLPPSALATVALQKLNNGLGETLGWPQLVRQAAGVYRSLPPRDRRDAVLLADDYGTAGALDHYGPALGLPRAFSGHNSYWHWGPPAPPRTRSSVVIGVGLSPLDLRGACTGDRIVAHITNPWGVANDEAGTPIWVCRITHASWRSLWPGLKHYG